MAHEFDTGLPRPLRTMLRDGVIELLSGLLAPAGYLRAVIAFGGVVRGYTDELGIERLDAALNGRAPAIAIAVGDRVAGPGGVGGYNHKGDVELILYHYSNHPESLMAGRTAINTRALVADTRDPGLEIMMEHAEELLIGQRVGRNVTSTPPSVTNPIGEVYRHVTAIQKIQPTREEEVATDSTRTIWAQRYTVQVQRSIDRYRNVSQMLEEIRTVLRNSDPAVEDIVAEDQLIPGEAVLELQNTTIDTPP